jgi:hypothetical protein
VIASLMLLAVSALPLGVWPTESGDAAITVDDIEFYILEPETSYGIVAAQPLSPPLKKAEPASVRRLVALAKKLGADAVLLLGEMAEKASPPDPDAALPVTGQYSIAVFLVFDEATGWENKQTAARRSHLVAQRGFQPSRHPRMPVLDAPLAAAILAATDNAATPHP